MSCGVGRRRGLDPALLWLWRRPAATAPSRPLAWEPQKAKGAAQRKRKKKKKKKKKLNHTKEWRSSLGTQQVKDPPLSLQWLGLLLWCRFSPWPRNFPWASGTAQTTATTNPPKQKTPQTAIGKDWLIWNVNPWFSHFIEFFSYRWGITKYLIGLK